MAIPNQNFFGGTVPLQTANLPQTGIVAKTPLNGPATSTQATPNLAGYTMNNGPAAAAAGTTTAQTNPAQAANSNAGGMNAPAANSPQVSGLPGGSPAYNPTTPNPNVAPPSTNLVPPTTQQKLASGGTLSATNTPEQYALGGTQVTPGGLSVAGADQKQNIFNWMRSQNGAANAPGATNAGMNTTQYQPPAPPPTPPGFTPSSNFMPGPGARQAAGALVPTTVTPPTAPLNTTVTAGGKLAAGASPVNSPLVKGIAGQANNFLNNTVYGPTTPPIVAGIANQANNFLNTATPPFGTPTTPAQQALHYFSDENLKTDINPATRDIKAFMQAVGAHSYQYKQPEVDGQGTFVGPMAQELEESGIGSGTVVNTPRGKMVDTGRLTLVNTSALSVLSKEHDRLQKQFEALKKQIKR